MARTERILDLVWWNGWESDDIFKWPENSFYSGENIEVRKDLSGLTLASKIVDTTWTIDGTIISMENLETLGIGTTSWVIVCTSTGKVYLNGVLKQTLATGTTEWNQIIGIGTAIISGVQYIYYVTKTNAGAGKIHRSNINLTTWNVSHKSFTVATGIATRAICIYTGDYLYIGIWNKIVSIYIGGEILADTGNGTNGSITLPQWEYITGFTQFQDSFKIYTRLGNTGVQYGWDGFAIAPTYRQEWRNQPILGVVNDGAFDYAVLGFSSAYSGLYLISGTQKQELRINLEASAYSRLLDGYLSIRKWLIYISGGGSGESTNYGVYTYWNYYPGTPKSIIQQYSLGVNQFYMHSHSTAESYFACADGKVYYIEHNNPATTTGVASTGYVISHIYQGSILNEMAINKIRIGFKLPTATTINIYLRDNLGGAWLLAKTINTAGYAWVKTVTVYESEINDIWIGNFNELQVKLEMFWSGSLTPIIKRCTLFLYDINLQ